MLSLRTRTTTTTTNKHHNHCRCHHHDVHHHHQDYDHDHHAKINYTTTAILARKWPRSRKMKPAKRKTPESRRSDNDLQGSSSHRKSDSKLYSKHSQANHALGHLVLVPLSLWLSHSQLSSPLPSFNSRSPSPPRLGGAAPCKCTASRAEPSTGLETRSAFYRCLISYTNTSCYIT